MPRNSGGFTARSLEYAAPGIADTAASAIVELSASSRLSVKTGPASRRRATLCRKIHNPGRPNLCAKTPVLGQNRREADISGSRGALVRLVQ
jgi:hypothetical protein